MKKILFLHAIVLMLLSCNRKQISLQSSGSEEVRKDFENSNLVAQLVDTTKREDLEVVYTKVEYYPPGATDSTSSRRQENGTAMPKVDTYAKGQSYHPPPAGPVKSVETYTIKRKREALGKVKLVSYSETKTDSSVIRKTAASQITKPAKDPYRWRYIFYIFLILLVAAVFFWVRKKFSIAGWIKKIFKYPG